MYSSNKIIINNTMMFMRHRSGQNGNETAKPVEFCENCRALRDRRVLSSARTVEFCKNSRVLSSARTVEFCENRRVLSSARSVEFCENRRVLSSARTVEFCKNRRILQEPSSSARSIESGYHWH